MAANANQPGHDPTVYCLLIAIMGLIIGGVGLIVAVMIVDVRATRAEQQTTSAERCAEEENLRSGLQAWRGAESGNRGDSALHR